MLGSAVLGFLPGQCVFRRVQCRRLPRAPSVLRYSSARRLRFLSQVAFRCKLLARLTARLHFFLKEMLELHPESLRDVPQA